jgi:hypothetical protein
VYTNHVRLWRSWRLSVPETLTIAVGKTTSKSGETNGKAWTSYGLYDGDDKFIGSTLDGSVLGEVKAGDKIKVEREKKGDFWNLISVKPAAKDAEVSTAPPQVRAKTDPDDERGINARRALQDSVAHCIAVPTGDVSIALSVADSFFDWLMSKSNGAAPEKPAQSLPGASEQPASEGQIKEIAELLAVLEKQTPASPDPNWTWTNEAQSYCKANFEKSSLVSLTKAEANQLREHLEERVAAIQAESGIPF